MARTVSQTINLQAIPESVSKYITRIDENGITVHPENIENNNFLQINSDGVNILKNNTIVASYGENIVLGTDESKVIITNESININKNQTTVATFSSSGVQLGNNNNFHVKMTDNELGFYQKTYRVAYINNNQLYITQSVVLQQMDLGTPFGFVNPVTEEVGKGQWSWKVHPNGENPSRNNLNLKWIG